MTARSIRLAIARHHRSPKERQSAYDARTAQDGLQPTLTEWTRPSLLIWIVLLDWLTVHEPGLLTPGKSKDSLPFEADLISSDKADLSFDLMLTERVKATRRADGGFDLEVVGESDPLFPDTVPIEPGGAPLRSIWLDGSQLVPDALNAA